MASRKNSNPNKPIIMRVILMMFVWVFFILFTLACISFSPSDPPSHMAATFTAVTYHNWVGAVGARMAYLAMQRIGPGVFVGIVLLGIALVIWTKGEKITQFALRMIGAALLIAAVSTLFNLFGGSGPFGEGAGGMLGIAIGSFLSIEFKHGAWFLLIATFVVGGLLAADEFMLALPARLLWVGRRIADGTRGGCCFRSGRRGVGRHSGGAGIVRSQRRDGQDGEIHRAEEEGCCAKETSPLTWSLR